MPAHPVDVLPWPNVRGKRCLDVSGVAGLLEAELSRRGAAEVTVAEADQLDPERLGRFDVVVGVDVLVGRRDPVGAFEAIRRVTEGTFLSAEPIDVWLSVVSRDRPRFRLGDPDHGTWWLPNGAGHRRLLEAARFQVERISPRYVVPAAGTPAPATPNRLVGLARRLVIGSDQPGVLHKAVLARPR